MFTHKLWRKALAVGVSSTLVLHLFAYQLPTAVAAENEEVQQNESIDPCQEDNLFEIVVVNLFGCKVKLHGYKFEDTNANQQWDDGEAGIADWAMYAVKPIGSFDVDSGGVATDSMVLEDGHEYIVQVSGTFDAGDSITADAKYSIRTPNTVWTDSVQTYEIHGPTLIDLQIDGVSPAWGAFNDSHIYFTHVTGAGAAKSFRINDGFPSNNFGQLAVNVFEVVDTAVTDSNGYYELTVTGWHGQHPVRIIEDTHRPDWLQTFPGSGAEFLHTIAWDEVEDNYDYDFGNSFTPIAPPVCVPGNLVRNGGFEEPVVTDVKLWDIFPTGTPGLEWSANKVDGDPSTGVEIQAGFAGWSPHSGQQFAELDADHPIRMFQTVNTVPGVSYNLTFAFSARPGTAAENNAVEVYVDGVSKGIFTAPATLTDDTDWQVITLNDLVAVNGYMSIKFIDRGTPADSLGTFIDDVDLRCDDSDVTDPGDDDSNNEESEPTLTLVATKIVCDDPADLPTWESDDVVTSIDATTASDFLAEHSACHTAEGWDFQWSHDQVSDPGGDLIGEADTGIWVTFGSTDVNGEVSIDIATNDLTDLDVREVLQAGYQTFDTQAGPKLFCGDDFANVSNNWEKFTAVAADQTLYCVAFNLPTTEESVPEQITGHKFNDSNANGAWDEDESGIEDWKILLGRVLPCDEECDVDQVPVEMLALSLTDSQGEFSFPLPERSGQYLLFEESRDGWEPTSPISGDTLASLFDLDFTLVETTSLADVYFEVTLEDTEDQQLTVVAHDPFDFGNHSTDSNFESSGESSGGSGGGGGGGSGGGSGRGLNLNPSANNITPPGTVLGDSDDQNDNDPADNSNEPEPIVLGAEDEKLPRTGIPPLGLVAMSPLLTLWAWRRKR